MRESWFAETNSEEEREAVKQDIALAQRAFSRLAIILEGMKKKNPHDYDVANWASLQADVNGWNRAIDNVLDYIKQEG